MLQLVEQNLDITKVSVERISAIKYFEAIKDDAKANIMKYNTNTYKPYIDLVVTIIISIIICQLRQAF